MKTTILSLATTMLLVGTAVPAPVAAQQKQAVQFARGTNGATLKGSITGDLYRDYLVNARAGQILSVKLTNPDGRAYFNVMPPGSVDVADFVGSRDGNSYSAPLSAGGNWTVRVYQMRASGRRSAVANYTLGISVTGGGGGGDARVAGTAYNATASIPCVAEPDKPMKPCQAGVKRAGGGNAVVTVTTPDGGRRVITFRAGKAVSSDSQAGLTVERRGDLQIVRIGTVEAYQIPDAFILGG